MAERGGLKLLIQISSQRHALSCRAAASMKITHNKEHCFLAVWALQQYGGPRVAESDADDENDDARGAKKKFTSP